MHTAKFFQDEFNDFLELHNHSDTPHTLYDPVIYIMSLGGKRVRPILVLITSHLLGGDYKEALAAALSLEVFHNFSLVHDDIMDRAPLRRGKSSVHEKWDLNTAILSGDVMLIAAYQLLEVYDAPMFKQLVPLFTRTAREVCAGQQYDMDFESQDEVSVEEYLNMIRLKTAVLLGAAMQMGAIIGNKEANIQKHCYEIGLYLGMAFQLQDDYLDAFGDQAEFGKQVGGDIATNKKTYLYIQALNLSTAEQRTELRHYYNEYEGATEVKISRVKQLFKETGAAADTSAQVKTYTLKAFDLLDSLEGEAEVKKELFAFAQSLMGRIS
ncbi:MAG: polyprenyl synthetase family protein [Flavobacteriaceae bacterium]|nr:polyprenyl synthetase family protein [Flavobacteriaceae bacterium]